MATKKRDPKNLANKIARGKSAMSPRHKMGAREAYVAKSAPKTKTAAVAPKKQRKKSKSQRGDAPKMARGRKIIKIDGRNVPSNARYKTGHWRPVRQDWMNDSIFKAVKFLNQMRRKEMAKEARNHAMGDKIYGKQGPGHAGYGTGQLQKWADKLVKQGMDPHFVDLTKWAMSYAKAFDYWNDGSFKELAKRAEKDGDVPFADVLTHLTNKVPELQKLSKSDVKKMIERQFYLLQYGPDGRAK